MSGSLKADTVVYVKVGPFVDATDGVTPETGVTLGAADQAELLKPGTTNTTDISGNSWGAITGCDGWYWLGLTAANLDTEGIITVVIQDASVCLSVWREYEVRSANVYDSLHAAAATDYLQVDQLQLGGATQSATDLKDFADAGYDPATNKVQGVVLVDTCTANSDMRGTDSVVLAGPTKAEMDTAHALLATPAQVNAEVVDALATDAYAEETSPPAANAALSKKINFIFAFLRNKKTQTATTQLLRNDADDGTIATSTVSDDSTTAIKGKFV